jgi:hypothetical protein
VRQTEPRSSNSNNNSSSNSSSRRSNNNSNNNHLSNNTLSHQPHLEDKAKAVPQTKAEEMVVADTVEVVAKVAGTTEVEVVGVIGITVEVEAEMEDVAGVRKTSWLTSCGESK